MHQWIENGLLRQDKIHWSEYMNPRKGKQPPRHCCLANPQIVSVRTAHSKWKYSKWLVPWGSTGSHDIQQKTVQLGSSIAGVAPWVAGVVGCIIPPLKSWALLGHTSQNTIGCGWEKNVDHVMWVGDVNVAWTSNSLEAMVSVVSAVLPQKILHSKWQTLSKLKQVEKQRTTPKRQHFCT